MKIVLHTSTDRARIVKVIYNWKQPLFEPAFKPFNVNDILTESVLRLRWLEINNLPAEGYYWETDDDCNNEDGPFSSEAGAGQNYIYVHNINAKWEHWFNVNRQRKIHR